MLQPRLLLYFNTNKPHSFFCRIPVVLENRRSSRGGGGGAAHPLHPPPRSAPESRHKLPSTANFIDAIKTIKIPDDHKLVSFDVKSLFTSIPLQMALGCTENAIKNSTVELPLPTDDIMDLLNLCLTLTYFQYNDKHYKQLLGTAMSSLVSVVVAEIVMQNIEEQAQATYTRTVPLWLRYVDDTFTAVHN